MGNAAAKPVHDRTYDFRKRPAGRPSPPGRPEVIPDSVVGVDPKKGGDVVNLRWSPPHENGGAHITGYLVERREMGQAGLGPGVWVRANAVLARAPRLAVASLEPGRRYQFRVRAENAAGLVSDPSSPSEPLAIGYQGGIATPPRFITNLTDTLAIEETRVDFVVDIAGAPAPSVCWYKDSNEIFSTRRTRVATGHGRSSLTFHQVGLADEGEIRCTATNKAGHAVTRAMLKVEAPPHLRLPRSLNKEVSGSPGLTGGDDGLLFHLDEVIRLRVGVTGRPQPEVTWFHNGEKLTPGERVEIMDSVKHSTLRIPAACRSDRGEYKAKAVNSHGQDSASFLVTVTDRPLPPSNVGAKLVQVGETQVKTSENEEEMDEETKPSVKYYLRLSWSPPEDDGGCGIGSYIVEYYRIGWNVWLKGATCRQLSISLDNLVAGSEYRFRVKAENPYGVSEPSSVSESVFLPDPKRGLMEPLEQGPESADSEWLAEQERMREAVEKRAWEEEQREQLQRKRREVEIEEKEEEEWRQKLRRQRLDLTPSPGLSPIPSPTWGGNTSPRSDYVTDKEGPFISEEHGGTDERRMEKEASSVGAEGTEFMLVLVPPKDSDLQQEERGYYRRKSNASEGPRELEPMEEGEGEEGEERSMAPPMSLSAPVISGAEDDGAEEAMMHPLRNAVSSTELLHERAMARIYQAAAEEEAASARRGSVGGTSMRRGSTSSRRDSVKDRENWKEIGDKMKEEEEKAKKDNLREGIVEESDEERGKRALEEKEEVEEEGEEEEEDHFQEEEESEEEMEEEEDEEEELRRIEERDRRRAEAIMRQDAELAASEERTGGLSFGAGGRSGRMTSRDQPPPVPPHRGIPSPPRTPEAPLQRESYDATATRPRPTSANSQQDSEDVTLRKYPTTRAPVPALHISTIEDYDDDDGKALDPTSVVIGHYGDIIKEISSRVRKASPTLYLSREELKARAEEDFDPFEHGLLVGETEAEVEVEEKEEVVAPPEEQEEPASETEEREVEKAGVVAVKEEEVTKEIVLARPPPPPPRVLTPIELEAGRRMRLIIDSFTTVCLLGVASWLLMNGYDRTAAALVGLIAAKELYKALLRRFPFLRRT